MSDEYPRIGLPQYHNCKSYGDAKNGGFAAVSWPAPFITDMLTRHEPCILSCQVLNIGPFAEGTVRVGSRGTLPHWRITPIMSDTGLKDIGRGSPSYEVDGGLLALPFAASVELVWPDRPDNVGGAIVYEVCTYAHDESLPAIGIENWTLTVLFTDGQSLNTPSRATRVCVPDSGYGVTVRYNGGPVLPAPFQPTTMGAAQTLQVNFVSPPLPATVTHVPVVYRY